VPGVGSMPDFHGDADQRHRGDAAVTQRDRERGAFQGGMESCRRSPRLERRQFRRDLKAGESRRNHGIDPFGIVGALPAIAMRNQNEPINRASHVLHEKSTGPRRRGPFRPRETLARSLRILDLLQATDLHGKATTPSVGSQTSRGFWDVRP